SATGRRPPAAPPRHNRAVARGACGSAPASRGARGRAALPDSGATLRARQAGARAMLRFRCAPYRGTAAAAGGRVAVRKFVLYRGKHSLRELSMKKQHAGDGAVIIKKYANRRLYNTESSSYITLD